MSHDFGESDFDFKLGVAGTFGFPSGALVWDFGKLENWMHGMPGMKRTLEIIGDTLRQSNIAMENPPFEDVFPIQDGDFPLLCLFTGG